MVKDNMPTTQQNDDRVKFADVELIKFMQSIGFELSHHEDIADWFVKDEGTCEMTLSGAIEAREAIQRLIAEARIDEVDNVLFAPYGGKLGSNELRKRRLDLQALLKTKHELK